MNIIGTLFRPLFATVLVGVSYGEDSCTVYMAKKRGGAVVEENKREFKIVKGQLSAETIKYIQKIKRRYAYTYLSVLSKTTTQILVPGAKKANIANFGVDEREYKSVKLPNAFVLMRRDDIAKYQDDFKKARGLDFLFSPYVLLFFKCKTFLGDKPKMFVLQEKESLATIIKTRKETLYGSFLLIDSDEPGQTAADSITKSVMNQDEASDSKSADDLDNLDTELGDLEQELQDFDSFDFSGIETSESSVTADDDSESAQEEPSDNINDLGLSTSIVNLLQSSLKDFYQNALYDSDFVEEVVIFDCCGISSQAMNNIRSNLMMDVSIVGTDLLQEIVNLSQIELDS